MKSKAIFLDRDGTITKSPHPDYEKKIIQFNNHVINYIQKKKTEGYLIILVSNQPDIALKKVTFHKWLKIHTYITDGLSLDDQYICFHHPKSRDRRFAKICNCRKPLLGMIYQAQEDWDLDIQKCKVIGDTSHDYLLAKNLKIPYIHPNDLI